MTIVAEAEDPALRPRSGQPGAPPAGTFAILERSDSGNRVLVVLDTRADAEDIALELRKRGLQVTVQQGHI